MNKFLTVLVAMMVTLFAVNGLAWNPPPSPKPQSAISDQSHVLSDEAHARLDAKLKEINRSTANEIAVLILPSLDGEAISDVGYTTAKTWGVGKKDLDNGVLIVLAMKEHKSRIEVGKGAEGDLPDLKCHDILQNTLRPHMRHGDVEGGLEATINDVVVSIANHKADMASGRKSSDVACDTSGVGMSGSDVAGWVIMLGLLGICGWWIIAMQRSRRRQEQMMLDLADQSERIRRRYEQQSQKIDRITTPPSTGSGGIVIPPRTEAVRTTSSSKRQEEEDENRRRRQREEETRRSSYSSSDSSSDWSSGSSGGGFDSGGGFGGGDFGGGGSSGDW